MKRACAAGDTVDYLLVAGATHGEELNATVDDVAAWFADRVSGAPTPQYVQCRLAVHGVPGEGFEPSHSREEPAGLSRLRLPFRHPGSGRERVRLRSRCRRRC